jgi:hypothetical protein
VGQVLIYHPAFDGYHCVFRMLSIAEKIRSLEVDKARILDFFLVFPGAVKSVRLPDELKSLRPKVRPMSTPFRDPVSNMATFIDMRHIQEAALKSIAASGLIELSAFASGRVARTDAPIPEALNAKMQAFLEGNDGLTAEILQGLSQLPLLGVNGLKDRSKLMDFRYDFA